MPFILSFRSYQGRRAHPFAPIATVTSGARGGNGCARRERRVRAAKTGAPFTDRAGPVQKSEGVWVSTWCAPFYADRCSNLWCARRERVRPTGTRGARGGNGCARLAKPPDTVSILSSHRNARRAEFPPLGLGNHPSQRFCGGELPKWSRDGYFSARHFAGCLVVGFRDYCGGLG